MNNEVFLSNLAGIEGTAIGGASTKAIEELLRCARLPPAHCDLLMRANGISTYGGYFRLFGCSSPVTVDMVEWNSQETWRFAWGEALEEFWFFGETAWGDQYAYRKQELQDLRASIYFLEGITMNAEIIAEDFSTFLESEFYKNASRPYDDQVVEVRKRLGDLSPLEHIAYVPSLLITGIEDVESVSKVDAVASMIIGGDLYRQVADESQDRQVKALETFRDENGRTRLRVIWS